MLMPWRRMQSNTPYTYIHIIICTVPCPAHILCEDIEIYCTMVTAQCNKIAENRSRTQDYYVQLAYTLFQMDSLLIIWNLTQ